MPPLDSKEAMSYLSFAEATRLVNIEALKAKPPILPRALRNPAMLPCTLEPLDSLDPLMTP